MAIALRLQSSGIDINAQLARRKLIRVAVLQQHSSQGILRPIRAAKSPVNAAGGVDGQRKGQHHEYRGHPIRLLRRLVR
jgi:hypothetical protein